MVVEHTQTAAKGMGLDRPEDRPRQAAPSSGRGRRRRERLRLRTFVLLRWSSVAAQIAALTVVRFVLDFQVPLMGCLALIGASAGLNVALMLIAEPQRLARESEAALQIAFDILQLAGVLYLTGGIVNPFALLLIAPVTLAAATLSPRCALGLGALAGVAIISISIWRQPLPWITGPLPGPPPIYELGLTVAALAGVVLIAGYAGFAAAESARMEVALHMAETVLAREQRLSALGGLAAAAAHELGTPLSTISLVAKEMARELPAGPLREDADLLVSQALRCREILRGLSETPEAGDLVHARMSLSQLLEEVVEPYRSTEISVNWSIAGAPGAALPEVIRLPEIIHAFGAFVENAVDFAQAEVRVVARYDPLSISIEVHDDGPGFSPEVFAKLGEPYITSRPGAEGSRTGHEGLGLGFFIAKTLLERTGAAVDFRNARSSGAVVTARWPRQRIEASAQ